MWKQSRHRGGDEFRVIRSLKLKPWINLASDFDETLPLRRKGEKRYALVRHPAAHLVSSLETGWPPPASPKFKPGHFRDASFGLPRVY
jgi:hypothetical protein